MTPESDAPLNLPADWVFGVASSAASIEGDGDHGRTASVWDVFARAPGRIADGSDAAVAVGHLGRMPADVALLRDLDVGAYRFSVSWSRVRPGGGATNPAGLDFYDRLVDELLAAGIDPWLTLYRWDLPLELMLDGGWLERHTADKFADYVASVAQQLGDRVRSWITLDQPGMHSFYGHGVGIDAPGLTLLGGAFTATHHLLLGHARALEVLRSVGAARVGIMNHHTSIDPATDSDADRRAARLYDAIHNEQFSMPILDGEYPELLTELPGTDLSVVADGDPAVISAPLDFYGVAYDHPRWVAAAPDNNAITFTMVDREALPHTGSGWPIQPASLTRTLAGLAARYPGVVLFVETGAAYPDPVDGSDANDDAERIQFLGQHLQAAAQARAAGADVRGFFWSHLLDGWEYGDGFSRQFGLVRVDRETLERHPRRSFGRYAEIIARGRVPGPDRS